MSRIGNKSIELKSNVTVTSSNGKTVVKGPKGELSVEINPLIDLKIDEKTVSVSRSNDQPKTRALHGLYRALIANMITGVSEGFEKNLEIIGVGYRVQKKGNGLMFSLGYSHQIEVPAKDGIEFQVVSDTKLKISGTDKQLVGQVAADIRNLRPPEPYKGKGIKYVDEIIRRKAGKAGKK